MNAVPLPSGSRQTVRVAGGTRCVFRVGAGDRVRIVDIEGGQPGVLTVVDETGTPAADRLGAVGSSSARPVANGLALSGADCLPGTVLDFAAPAALHCTLTVPAVPSSAAAVAPVTDYEIAIERAAATASTVAPPAPLAEPRLDLRIARGTAQAYRVAAGEYIQVVDIEGRQCSDFLAFDPWLLEQGVECGLDGTVTRTLTGRSYPGPGLASKFFDTRMRPMLEVVQDTCGRHDTFALACTARYYENMGYPGHPNCSENFNAALAPHGVAPRPGWPAINFFYNTAIGAGDAIGLDEPWSRPGDYVLMRALTDLLCASSACPDDIDPANGWNPTDIQVRVYPA